MRRAAAILVCLCALALPAFAQVPSNDLCAADLWCDMQTRVCRIFLNPGDTCSNPGSCGPDATCAHDPVTRMTDCVPNADGGADDGGADVDGSADGPSPR